MLLNCDLGESYGSWTIGADAAVMPHIDQANIACGFHAGDPLTIRQTLTLAAAHGVAVGAHPAYPDLVGFGRRSMTLSSAEIIASVHYQVAALDGMAKNEGLTLDYVKPHGALYHDMMARAEVRAAIFQAIRSYNRSITLVIQATAQADEHRIEAADAGVQVQFEAFADRCYADDGTLVHRSKADAVHPKARMLEQVAQLIRHSTITTQSGHTIPLQADTLCVHGDNPEAVRAIEAIRSLLIRG